jgi:hypothetical protein
VVTVEADAAGVERRFVEGLIGVPVVRSPAGGVGPGPGPAGRGAWNRV